LKKISLFIFFLLLNLGCFADEKINGLSFNFLGLITTDLSQYPLGLEFTYERRIKYGYLECIVEYDYSLQNNNSSNTLYFEPRYRTEGISGDDFILGELYLSAGIFCGAGVQNNELEPIFGFDLNMGLFKNITDNFFFNISTGIQYPDFPLTRSYRIHYLIPEINYICLRNNMGMGFWF
jgi:hypothetical protein